MFLYRVTNPDNAGRFVATQDEARGLRKATGGLFEKMDIPTSGGRENMAAFLNSLLDEEGGIATLSEMEVEATLIEEASQPEPQRPATAPINVNDTDAIMDFIFDRATVAQVENIMSALGTRIGELAKQRR